MPGEQPLVPSTCLQCGRGAPFARAIECDGAAAAVLPWFAPLRVLGFMTQMGLLITGSAILLAKSCKKL